MENRILFFRKDGLPFLLTDVFGTVVQNTVGFLTPTAATGSTRFLPTNGETTA